MSDRSARREWRLYAEDMIGLAEKMIEYTIGLDQAVVTAAAHGWPWPASLAADRGGAAARGCNPRISVRRGRRDFSAGGVPTRQRSFQTVAAGTCVEVRDTGG